MNRILVGSVLIVVVIIAGLTLTIMPGFFVADSTGNPTGAATGAIDYDDSASFEEKLAKCLTAKGVKMYGAEWCGHCNNQKAMFGDALQYVDYVECTEDAAACNAAGVTGYPTWTSADGTKYPGEKPLENLAELFECEV